MQNPFKYGCVVSGDHFCLRPQAERDLRRFAESGQNVVVQGERRMGKTSLVRKALGGMRGRRLVFIDLYYIGSSADLCRRIMEGIGRLKADMPFLKKVMSLVPRLRPVLAIDPNDGSPKISVDARAADEPESLDAVMVALEQVTADGNTSVVFDEFQDVRRLANADRVLAEMRSHIQLQENVPYFFLGSVRHEMWDIFNNSRSPFFKSAAAYEVGPIPDEDFVEFLVRRFRVGKRVASVDLAGAALKTACGVTGDVQEFCAALWDVSVDGATLTEADFPKALAVIFMREQKGFEKSVANLTATQMSVLRGLANRPGDRIYGEQFLQTVGIANAGAVHKAVKRLVANDLIYEVDGKYRFTDSFFRAWVKQSLG